MIRKFLDLTDDDLKNKPYFYDEEQLIYTLQTFVLLMGLIRLN